MSRTPLGLGVTAGVWINDQLRRLEDSLDVLTRADLTLVEMDRLERALTRAHAANLVKVNRYPEADR